MKKRYLHLELEKALSKKMVFIGGPRQVGKTTLSLQFLDPASVRNPGYLNWDRGSDKSLILRDEIPLSQTNIILDEIHKFKKWRSLVKGLYDKYHEDHKFIVTGSARLDHFRKGGDSLLGRYRYFRLHPFTWPELGPSFREPDLKKLLRFGGFPEPLFSDDENEHRIWQRDRLQKVVSEDLRDLENVREISLVLLLAESLQGRVGSPLSLNNLAEDLQVSQPTVRKWIEILSNLYFCYQISPFGAPKLRAVKKLQKLYLWDWSQVENPGAKLENFVASHLLKYCHYIEDTQGHTMELRYLRDIDGREVDFVVLKNKKPLFAVECKSGDQQLNPSISYFKERTNIPEFYQVHFKERDYGDPKHGRVLPFKTFCKELGLV